MDTDVIQRTVRLTEPDDALATKLLPLCDQVSLAGLIRHLIRAEARRRGLLHADAAMPEPRRGPRRKAKR